MVINRNDYLVLYDEEIGVVYSAIKGKTKATTVEHARNLEKVLIDYFENKIDEVSKHLLEEYLESAFKEYSSLETFVENGLLKTTSLRRLEMMIANDCNLNCKYCYAVAGSYKKKAQRMSAEAATMFLKKFVLGRYDEVKIVQFFGGEPTLCPKTIEAICSFFSDNVKRGLIKEIPDYTMVTNGTLIDENMAKIIAEHNIRVTVSIDGPIEINDILRVDKTGNGTYEKIKKGIENLKKYGTAPVLLEATYTTKHVEMGYSKKEIYDYLKKTFGVDNVMVADCEINDMDNSLVYLENSQTDTCENLTEDAVDKFNKLRVTTALNNNKYKDAGCDAGLESVAIMPNGDVFPCHRFAEFQEYRIAFWNDEDFDFEEYQGVFEKLVRCKRWNNQKCKDCLVRRGCSICPATMLLSQKDSWDRMCREERDIHKEYIMKCVKAYSNIKR